MSILKRSGLKHIPLPEGWKDIESEIALANGGYPIAVSSSHAPMRYINNQWEPIVLRWE